MRTLARALWLLGVASAVMVVVISVVDLASPRASMSDWQYLFIGLAVLAALGYSYKPIFRER